MEIEDLMAGDYVYNDKKQICKVCSINAIGIPYAEADNLAIDDGCFTLLYDYSGIPLTAEILEKNDFYYGYTSYEEDLASNTIAQLSEDDKGWCWDEGDVWVYCHDNKKSDKFFVEKRWMKSSDKEIYEMCDESK